jgi:hypothetical protein
MSSKLASSHQISATVITTANNVADQQAAECSFLIKHLCAYFGREIITRELIPLPNVSEPVLLKILEWCEHHKNDDPDIEIEKHVEINEWDQKYIAVDQEMLFEIILVRLLFSLPATHSLPEAIQFTFS